MREPRSAALLAGRDTAAAEEGRAGWVRGAAPPPAQLTTFIGRERETAAVRELLHAARLITLTGAGGSGKTRLALEVAMHEAAAFADGVAWVELAPLLNPELLAVHVADALGVRREDIGSARDALLEVLREQEMLLVLDNCEHLVEACAQLTEALLRGCPRLRVLATSREALGIGGEQAWLIPALGLPEAGRRLTPATATESAAIRLFVERARAVRPAFALTDDNTAAVAQICRRLDGLPLAIELAAARARALEPEQLAARLDDVFGLLTTGSRTALPRQRTLRGAIDWSHALLSEREQVLFRRLAVFSGGFTIDAAESVAAEPPLEARAVLDLLSGLVDKSLVMIETEAHEARYVLLETVRQFAMERLDAAGEADLMARRHATFYLERAEAAEPFLFAHDEGWVERLLEDLGNLRAAADWFERDPEGADGAQRLAAALLWFWFARGLFREGRGRVAAALARSGGQRTRARARALFSQGFYAYMQAEVADSRPQFEEVVEILRATADGSEDLAFGLAGLGWSLLFEGELDRAAEVLGESVDLGRRVSPRGSTTFALFWLGRVAQARGDFAAARAALEEAVEIGRATGNGPAIAHPATALSRLALAQDDPQRALGWLAVAVPVLQRIEHPWGVIAVAEDLARIAVARGDVAGGTRVLGALAAMREETGTTALPDDQAEVDRAAAAARASLGDAAFTAEHDAGRALSTAEFLDLAESMLGEPLPGPRPSAGPVLRVHGLGPVEVYRDGERLPATAWTYSKPRELLLYLLCHRRGRTRDQIGLAFWPDASPAQVKNNFHVTLHHLRKALGRPDWIELEEQRYRINPRLPVEFDATLFEGEVRTAQAALAGGAGDAAALERALARYRGDFLESEPAGDWHLQFREGWQRLCIEGLMALGTHYRDAGASARAAEAYRRVLARDELHEPAHRALMACLARTGERAEALRLYERLVARLRAEYDAAPEPETTAVHGRVQRAEPV